MIRRFCMFLIVILVALFASATAFAAQAGPGFADSVEELVPVSAGVNWSGVLMAVVGLAAVGFLIGWARKQKFDKIYLNVILMATVYASGFTTVIGLLLWAGVGSIILQVTSIVATAMFGFAMAYGRRATPFRGVVSPLNLPALVTFFLGLVVVIVGLGIGLDPFVSAQKAVAMAATAGMAEGANAAAANAVLLLVTPLLVYAGSVIQKFATRDADADDQQTT